MTFALAPVDRLGKLRRPCLKERARTDRVDTLVAVSLSLTLAPTFSAGPARERFRHQGLADYDVTADGQ